MTSQGQIVGSAHKPTPNQCSRRQFLTLHCLCRSSSKIYLPNFNCYLHTDNIKIFITSPNLCLSICLSQNWALHFQLLTKEYAITSKATNLKQNLFFSSNPNWSYFSHFSFMNMRNVLQPFWYPGLKSHIKPKDDIVNCPLLSTSYNLTAVLISLSLPNDVFPLHFPFHYCTPDFYHFFRQWKGFLIKCSAFNHFLFHLFNLLLPAVSS